MLTRGMVTDRALRVVRTLAAAPEALTRTALPELAGISAPTLQRALKDLRDAGWLTEAENGEARRLGAPVYLSRRAGIVVGVDVGRGHMRAVAADIHGRPLSSEPACLEGEVDLENRGAAILESVLDLILDALSLASVGHEPPFTVEEVRSIAVGVPTPVDADGKVVGMFLPQWTETPLRDILLAKLKTYAKDTQQRLHREFQLTIAKDADLGALSAWRDFEVEQADAGSSPSVILRERDAPPQEGAAEDDADIAQRAGPRQKILVFLKASHGIDASIVCDGTIVAGMQGIAAQIGHLWVPAAAEVDLSGFHDVFRAPAAPECQRCGRVGCLESVASGRALLRQLERLYGVNAPSSVDELTREVNQQQTEKPDSRNAVIASAVRIGTVLAEVARLADPTRVVVGGLLATTGDTFISPLRSAYSNGAFSGLESEVVPVPPSRVRRMELEGAVELARRNLRFGKAVAAPAA